MAVNSYIDEKKAKGYIPFQPEAQVVYGDVQVFVNATQIADETASTFVVAGPFPAGAVVADSDAWQVIVTDLDTHATPTLTWDLTLAADKENASPDVLISNSTVGQSAGTDFLDANENNTTMADLYLLIKIEDDVATGAAGSFRVKYAYRIAAPARQIDLTGVTGVVIE